MCQSKWKEIQTNLKENASNIIIMFVKFDLSIDDFASNNINKEIHILNQQAVYIGMQIGFHFGQLAELEVNNCGLLRVYAKAFYGFNKLETLNLDQNETEKILIQTSVWEASEMIQTKYFTQ